MLDSELPPVHFLTFVSLFHNLREIEVLRKPNLEVQYHTLRVYQYSKYFRSILPLLSSQNSYSLLLLRGSDMSIPISLFPEHRRIFTNLINSDLPCSLFYAIEFSIEATQLWKKHTMINSEQISFVRKQIFFILEVQPEASGEKIFLGMVMQSFLR